MSLCVIVPVKRLECSKARLSSILSLSERKNFTLSMLKHVLTILTSCAPNIVVIGVDEEVKEIANNHNALFELDKTNSLNRALIQSINRCITNGFDSVLIIAADLPFLSRQDIKRVLENAEDKSIIICPSKDCGTNALFIRSPKAIPLRFGPYSFRNHLTETMATDRKFMVYWSPSLSFDLDNAEDLQILKKGENWMSERFR